MRPRLSSGDFLFADARNQPLKTRNVTQILHRLSRRAGLAVDRRLHPHALRHFAATSWLRHGVGLDQVRRLLGHSTIQMTLRYSSLVAADLQQAHRSASVVERLFEKSDLLTRRVNRVLPFR